MGIAGVLGGASGFEPWRSTSYRVTFGGVLLLLWAIALKKKFPNWRLTLKCLALGVALGIHWFAFFQSIDYLGVLLGSALIGLEPLIIALFAAVLLKEKLPQRYKVGLTISLAGFLVFGIQAGFGQSRLWQGCGWAVFSYAVFALFVLANRVWVQNQSAITISALEMLGAIPLTWIMTPGPWLPAHPQAWLYAVGLGVFCTGIAYALYNSSMKVLTASIAGVLLSLEVVYGVLGGLVLGDRISPSTLFAVVLISNLLFVDLIANQYLKRRLRQQGT